MNNNFDSKKYWEKRYIIGGNSGRGSYGRLAEFKAEIINKFIIENRIVKIIEFGCGDGNQLSLFKIDNYIGLDVAGIAIEKCKKQFERDKSKSFFLYDPHYSKNIDDFKTELSLSLDVIFHIIEDDIFRLYMKHLFAISNKFVIIYSSDNDNPKFLAPHYKDRQFSRWIEINLPQWELIRIIKNKYPDESYSDFYIYKKKGDINGRSMEFSLGKL
jgi:hypothetical protein